MWNIGFITGLKEDRRNNRNLPRKLRKLANISSCWLGRGCFVDIYATELLFVCLFFRCCFSRFLFVCFFVCFFLSLFLVYLIVVLCWLRLTSSGRSHVGSLFTNKEQKRSGSWVALGPHMPSSFMTSQTQNNSVNGCVSRLSNVDFKQTGQYTNYQWKFYYVRKLAGRQLAAS